MFTRESHPVPSDVTPSCQAHDESTARLPARHSRRTPRVNDPSRRDAGRRGRRPTARRPRRHGAARVEQATGGDRETTARGAIVVWHCEASAMTIVADEICTELLRYAYALSTSGCLQMLTHAAEAGVVASFVIAAWHLRRKHGATLSRDPTRRRDHRALGIS